MIAVDSGTTKAVEISQLRCSRITLYGIVQTVLLHDLIQANCKDFPLGKAVIEIVSVYI